MSSIFPITDIRSTQLGRRLVKVMAKGTIAFCKKHGISLPATYSEFESTVVQASRECGLEGGIAFEDEEAGNKAVMLFAGPLGIDQALLDLPLSELNERIRGSKELQEKFVLLRQLLRGKIQEDDKAFAQLGAEFAPIAEAFQRKYCWRRAVFEAMQEVINLDTQKDK